MGMSTRPVPFFSDEIAIRPHSASAARYLDRKVTVRQFAKGQRVALEEVIGEGELIVRIESTGEFMQGPEV